MSVIKRTSMIAATLFLFVGATCAQETAKEKTGAISASIPALGFVNRPSRLPAQLQHAESADVRPFEVASIKPSRADDNMTRLFVSPGKFTTEAETIKDLPTTLNQTISSREGRVGSIPKSSTSRRKKSAR